MLFRRKVIFLIDTDSRCQLINFNMPDINWSTLSYWKFNSFKSNLDQVMTSPTHKHGNVLDQTLTDSAESLVDLIVHPLECQCIPSDHHLIYFNTCYLQVAMPHQNLSPKKYLTLQSLMCSMHLLTSIHIKQLK